MSVAHLEEHRKHVKTFLNVFYALLALTALTVAVSRIDFSHGMHIGVALLIAAAKASLVAAFFMHLKYERSWIFGVLFLCAVFFIALLFLPTWTEGEVAHYRNASQQPATPAADAGHGDGH